jgi:glycosyltransferase involved in cell wall biosynthesis
VRRLAIFAHNLWKAGGQSVGLNLVSAIGKLAPELRYLVAIPKGVGYEDVCRQLPNCEPLVFDTDAGRRKRLLFEKFELPREVRGFAPDLVLALGNFGLISPPCPQAVLMQSSYLVYPRRHFGYRPLRDTIAWDLRLFAQKRHFARQLPKTDLVLCQTSAVAKRVSQVFDYAGKTMITPNAVSARALKQGGDLPFPEPLAPAGDKFRLLCLARYYPHKNLEMILETFTRFREALQGVAVILTVEDDGFRDSRRFRDLLADARLEGNVINVGLLGQDELAQYYGACHALFLPTLLESFSGTYLEAMHFERPILTSDLDFAHEVCGDAALYFDPWSPESIRAEIERLENDPALAADLAAKGSVRLATHFRSWEQIAADLLPELRKIAKT